MTEAKVVEGSDFFGAALVGSEAKELQAHGTYGTPREPSPLPRQRFWLTSAIFAAAATMSLATMIVALVADDGKWTRFETVLGITVTPFQTLLGLAVGYYLADSRTRRSAS